VQPGSFIGQDGHAIHVKRAICIHEEDSGLLWKHTDYRPGGRAHAVRSRRLVISMICTVANYGIYYRHFSCLSSFNISSQNIVSITTSIRTDRLSSR
jgi:primary-amine oxidase